MVDNFPVNINKYNNSMKIESRTKSSHKAINNYSNRNNLHFEFDNLQNINKSLNYSLNSIKASKYKKILPIFLISNILMIHFQMIL